MLSVLGAALALLVAAALCVLRRRGARLRLLASQIPGPPSLPLLGNALDFATDPEHMMSVLTGVIRKYGDVARLWMGPDLNVVVAEPDQLKMLLSNPRNSMKGPTYRFMQEYIGGGILSGSGQTWRRHRKIASPNYGKRAIESYTSVFGKETETLVLRLRDSVGKKTDIYSEIVKTTSYMVCQTLMALNREETVALPHLHELINLTEVLYTSVFNRMTKWYYQISPVYYLSDAYKFYRKFHRMSGEFCTAIIEHRKRSLKDVIEKDDFTLNPEEDTLNNTDLGVIDRFILSNELNKSEMISETYTIFTSSQEASAKISCFMLLMMAYHPEYQDRLYAEIQATLQNCDYAVTGRELKRMTFLDMVFRECVRLFPIGAVIQRTIADEQTLGPYTVPAGCSLLAPIYQLSRDPRYWERPEQFYPEHFTPEHIARRPANSFLSFSVGPMDCLGRYFGAKLIKTIVVGVLRNYKVTSDEKYEDLKLKVVVSVTSKNGFKLYLHSRSDINNDL